ncbi:MAG: hypothetical protein Q7T82_03805 [Armatimonadota bacterium]|nr:hypothetical protein [Armatimonadota bacterium]
MRIEISAIVMALAFVIASSAAGAANGTQRTILFGVNYLPQVTCVEDFSPYWKTDNWTEKRMVTDMKIMKAMGCSCVRFHIMPALRTIGKDELIPAEKYVRMIDLGVKTARELGMRFHMDLDAYPGPYAEEVVKYSVGRYKGKIESYQIGNERWDFPEKPETLTWLQGIVELLHSIDPNAKVTGDFMVPDWVKIRDTFPKLYSELNPTTAHYYPVTDYRGWNQLYIDDLVDYLGNPTGRKSVADASYAAKRKLSDFGEYDAKAKSFDHDLYVGSYGWLDKDVWITEISSHGYWRWGNLTPEDKRAADWKRLVDAVAGSKNRVARMYHHCFRDKMSWREFGQGQSGIVYYDGSPRPATFAFKDMAEKYSPVDSPMRAIGCGVERVIVPDGAQTVALTITLVNKTAKALKGAAVLELPDGITAQATVLNFSLPAKRSETWTAQVNVSNARWGVNHVFVKINIPEGLVYGWGVIAKPKAVSVDSAAVLTAESSPVRYVQGYQAVQEFLQKYGDDCAIVTGPCIGSDMEMAYRLKCVLQAERCKEIPLRSSILALDVLNRPLIVIGTPVNNQISHAIEMTLPEDQRITAANPGLEKGVVNVVQAPFGAMNVDARFSPQCEYLGYYFGGCPAALYVAGPDDTGTKAAAYDLILRIWGKDVKY